MSTLGGWRWMVFEQYFIFQSQKKEEKDLYPLRENSSIILFWISIPFHLEKNNFTKMKTPTSFKSWMVGQVSQNTGKPSVEFQLFIAWGLEVEGFKNNFSLFRAIIKIKYMDILWGKIIEYYFLAYQFLSTLRKLQIWKKKTPTSFKSIMVCQ